MSASDRALLAAFLLAALPAAAEAPMTADEFEAFATGKTLDYAYEDRIHGSETYLPGRRVVDADTGGPCQSGIWLPRGTDICFRYDGDPALHCWQFWRDGDGLQARVAGSAPEAPPHEVTVADEPLACPAPDVGV